jgi:hypothetical protein
VAEHGLLSAGEHRRHPVALTADLAMADRVDTAVDRVQPAGPHAASIACRLQPSSCNCARDTTPCWRAASIAIAASKPSASSLPRIALQTLRA